jgi:hypothetical protein
LIRSAHGYLFGMILLASVIGLGWVPVIYVLSYHTAAKVIDYADRSLSAPPAIALQ